MSRSEKCKIGHFLKCQSINSMQYPLTIVIEKNLKRIGKILLNSEKGIWFQVKMQIPSNKSTTVQARQQTHR